MAGAKRDLFRYVFFGSALLAGVALAAGCDRISTASLAPVVEDFPPDALADYLPDDAIGVATLNLARMLDAPVVANNFRNPLMRVLQRGDVGGGWLAALGIDPRKDLQSLQMIHRRGANRPLIVVHGHFDTARFQVGPGELEEVRDGPDGCFRLFEYHDPDENKTTTLALAGDYLVACEARPPVVAALTYAANPRKSEPKDAALRNYLATVDRTQSLWISVPLGKVGPIARLSNKGLELALRPVFKFAKEVRGGVSCDKDIRAEFVFVAGTEDDAEQLETSLKSVCEVAQTAPFLFGKDKDLLPFFRLLASGETTRDGLTITLRCRWSAD
jgi:hypothetical protein